MFSHKSCKLRIVGIQFQNSHSFLNFLFEKKNRPYMALEKLKPSLQVLIFIRKCGCLGYSGENHRKEWPFERMEGLDSTRTAQNNSGIFLRKWGGGREQLLIMEKETTEWRRRYSSDSYTLCILHQRRDIMK